MASKLGPQSRLGFNVKLASGVLLLNLFVLVFAGGSLFQSHEQYCAATRTDTVNLSRILERYVAGVIDGVNVALYAISAQYERDLANKSLDISRLDNFLEHQHAVVPYLEGVRLADARGVVLCGTGVASRPRAAIADREFFQILKADPSRGLVISKPVLGRVSGKWVIVLARRVNRPDGGFAGVAYAALTLEYLKNTLSTLEVGANGVVALRDEGLGLIARFPAPRQANLGVGSKGVSRELQTLVRQGRTEGVFDTPNGLDNVARKVAFRKVGKYPLFIIAGRAKAEYLAPWYRQAAGVVSLALLFMAGSLQFSLQLKRSWRRQSSAAQSLSEQEVKFRTLADFTFAWEYWQGPAGDIIYMSPSCARITGYSQAEFAADPGLLLSVMHPEDRHLVEDHHRHSEPECTLDFRVLRRDGEIRWISHGCCQVFDPEGNSFGRRVSNHDITERKNLEQAVVESRRQLTDIIEFLPDATLVVDRDLKVIAWNRAMEEMSGVPKAEMLGRGEYAYALPFYGVRSPQLLNLLQVDRSAFPERYRNLVRKGEMLSAEVFTPALNGGAGAQLWVSAAPLYTARGERSGAIQVMRDISEQKRNEAALRETSTELDRFFSLALDQLCIADRNGDFRRLNVSWEGVLGYPIAELEGMNFHDLCTRRIWTPPGRRSRGSWRKNRSGISSTATGAGTAPTVGSSGAPSPTARN